MCVKERTIMTEYILLPSPRPSASVATSDKRFPVRRIFCVGRNYGAHAREMGFSDKEPPFSLPNQQMRWWKPEQLFLIRR